MSVLHVWQNEDTVEEVSSGHLEDLYQYVEKDCTKYSDLRKCSLIKLMTQDGISDYD